jgi:hypothetical protein
MIDILLILSELYITDNIYNRPAKEKVKCHHRTRNYAYYCSRDGHEVATHQCRYRLLNA